MVLPGKLQRFAIQFAGLSRVAALVGNAGEHKEPDTDTARARDFILKGRMKEARDILEPKVIDKKLYAPGIGIVQELSQSGPLETAALVSITRP